jgi:hypothetical protein
MNRYHSFHGHVTKSQNCFEMENLKEHSFTFERMCFDIIFCTGSGRTPDLKFVKNCQLFHVVRRGKKRKRKRRKEENEEKKGRKGREKGRKGEKKGRKGKGKQGKGQQVGG